MKFERSGVEPRHRWRRLQPAGLAVARRNPHGLKRVVLRSLKAILGGALLVSLTALCAAPAPVRSASKNRTGFSLSGLAFPSSSSLIAVAASVADANSVLAPDKGKLRITISGQVVGGEEFEISPSGDAWLARGSMTAHVSGGAEIKASGQLRLSSDGAPLRYEWSAQAQKKATGSVDFADGTAKCSADLGAASPMRKDFSFGSPRIAVLDNNLYYQYGVLARLYDWKAGGKQSFPVLIPQDMVPGTIDVEPFGAPQMQKTEHDALRVSTPDLEIIVFLDASHRMMRLEVPSSNVTVERE